MGREGNLMFVGLSNDAFSTAQVILILKRKDNVNNILRRI
jgi:hypothetical protein